MDQVHTDLVARGVEIEVEIADRDYGLRDFRITGPDNVDLTFGADIEYEEG